MEPMQSLTLCTCCVWSPTGISAIGTLLFLIYINCVVSSGKITVYINDIVLYQIIRSPMDYVLVQQDVDSICMCLD